MNDSAEGFVHSPLLTKLALSVAYTICIRNRNIFRLRGTFELVPSKSEIKYIFQQWGICWVQVHMPKRRPWLMTINAIMAIIYTST